VPLNDTNSKGRVSLWGLCVLLSAMRSAYGVTTPRPAWPLRAKTMEVVPGVQKAYLVDRQGAPFFYNELDGPSLGRIKDASLAEQKQARR